MKKIEKVLEVFMAVLAFTLVIVLGCYSYSKYIDKDKVANVFGYTFMVVKSNSMVPSFEYGDKLVVKLGASFVEGDIITYETDNVYVTHRVVDIIGDKVITKGDSNNVSDTPITKEQVVGVVKKIIK